MKVPDRSEDVTNLLGRLMARRSRSLAINKNASRLIITKLCPFGRFAAQLLCAKRFVLRVFSRPRWGARRGAG